jgi:hypothetical protein
VLVCVAVDVDVTVVVGLYVVDVTVTVVVVVVVVVVVAWAGPCAGTLPGMRTATATRITQAATRVLVVTSLLKSAPSRCST